MENILPTTFPALLFTWPSVPAHHADMVPLDALNSILSEGRKSFFYKEFVLTRKAIQASGFHNNDELGGTFTLFVLPTFYTLIAADRHAGAAAGQHRTSAESDAVSAA